MELRRSRVWNHHEVMYGIKPTGYTLMRDAIHVFDVIPCRRLATDAMPSLSAWIKRKKSELSSDFSFLVTRTGIEPMLQP